MFSIRKRKTHWNPNWHFPSALSPEAHAEWGLCKILEYMGLHEILHQERDRIEPNFEKTSKNTT